MLLRISGWIKNLSQMLEMCTDITYIHVVKEDWTYLASMMDLCSCKIIGYAYGMGMTAELAVAAVRNGLNVTEKVFLA